MNNLDRRVTRSSVVVLFASLVWCAAGCERGRQASADKSGDSPRAEAVAHTERERGDSAAPTEEHAHVHHAPHGGTLVELGDHFAHLEFVLNPQENQLTAYVLDGEAESAIRIEQPSISLRIESFVADSADAPARELTSLTLVAVANELTGETVGDTSQFVGTLSGVSAFDGVLESITVKGREFRDVRFSFPKGTE